MSSRQSLHAELAALGIQPKKGLGQNFLVDQVHRERIVSAAELKTSDAVLEIGPGPAVLTDLIAGRAGRVVAIELDDRLISYLRALFALQPHVTIVHGDVLKTNVGELMEEQVLAPSDRENAPRETRFAGYKVIANLPYYITGAAIQHLLEAVPPPDLLVLTVQREVAERMAASPPDMSLLAVGVQYYCAVEVIGRIPQGAFYPVPKVESAIVRLHRQDEVAASDIPAERFFRVARAGFSQRRKQLRNSLAAGLQLAPDSVERWLKVAGIDKQRRAETLSMQEWGQLARTAP